MLGFTYYTPTKVAFGKGSVERVGELMKQFGGTRVLIHYGGQSAVRSGVLDRVKKSLDEAGIFHVDWAALCLTRIWPRCARALSCPRPTA